MAQYIDKSAVVAKIEELHNSYMCYINNGLISVETFLNKDAVLVNIKNFIDTLEVKEVDFDNEYTEEVYSHLDSIKDTADRMTSGNFMHHKAAIKFSANTIAKVLELMGLKTQKGE